MYKNPVLKTFSNSNLNLIIHRTANSTEHIQK